MLTRTGQVKLVLIASLVISCSAIPVEEFIGYPFSSSDHQIFASNDDNAITVNIAESLLVNGTRYTAVHVSLNLSIFMILLCVCILFVYHNSHYYIRMYVYRIVGYCMLHKAFLDIV